MVMPLPVELVAATVVVAGPAAPLPLLLAGPLAVLAPAPVVVSAESSLAHPHANAKANAAPNQIRAIALPHAFPKRTPSRLAGRFFCAFVANTFQYIDQPNHRYQAGRPA